MIKIFFPIFISSLLTFSFLFLDTALAAVDCLKINFDSTQDDRDYCQKELDKIEAELVNLLEKQKIQRKKSGVLKKDIDLLNTKINDLKEKIKQRKLIVAQLESSIDKTNLEIKNISEKINRQHNSLSQFLKDINVFDNKNLVYLVFSEKDISTFYQDLAFYNALEEKTKKNVFKDKKDKIDTENEKNTLEKKEKGEKEILNKLENNKKIIDKEEKSKKIQLNISKNKEAKIEKQASEKRARAEIIRAALFPLVDSNPIPFGTALKYAKTANKITGVEPAFLLAIFKQESNLGSNVGLCYLTNNITGEGVSIKTGKKFKNVMHPVRDIIPFFNITASLNRDPWKTRVSCPIENFGYGGAMGPAQFIASTWDLIKNRISDALKISTPNPWNPRDAFVASAIYLSDLGGSGKDKNKQIKAACRYYGDRKSNCSYGKSVLRKIKAMQDDIDLIENN